MKDRLGRFMINWRIKAVLPYVRGYLLDMGCGTNQLTKHYGNGVGVDIYQWGNVDLIVKDSAHLPFENDAFDTVTCLAALNHIPNREAALAEMYRVLKPGGKVILTMIPPKTSRIWHFLRSPWDADQHERGMQHGEVFGLTRAQIRKLLLEVGFKDLKMYPFMFRINSIHIGTKSTKSNTMSPIK